MRNELTVGDIRVGTFAWGEVLASGALAGAAGGLLMAVGAALHAVWSGAGAAFPARLVGASLVGPTSLVLGAQAVLYGVALHFLTAMAFGVLFALLVDRTTRVGPALIGGVLMGIAAAGVMTYLVVPWVNPTLNARVPMMPGAWFLFHMLFGVGVAAAPALRRGMTTARPARTERPAGEPTPAV